MKVFYRLGPLGFLVSLCLYASPAWAQVDFTSSNLPIIVIDTDGAEIVDDPKINVMMGIIDNGSGNRNNLTDPFNDFEGTVGIEIRGSTSQNYPKKQYGVEVRDPVGKDSAVSLLGMPKESDWVLYAPYSDKTLMRNILAYQLGRDLGHYAPRTKLCEVVLNGQYQGVYVLIEKIKRDKNRVDIAKLKDEDISGEDVTGGYIIKIDKDDSRTEDRWRSAYPPPFQQKADQQIYFRYEYPKSEDIGPEQKAYIQQYIGAFEDALAGDNFTDSVEGYAKYIDVNSFIDFFIVNEISKDLDAYRLSTYMYKQKVTDGGKLVMGPLWDYNVAFGNIEWPCVENSLEGFAMDFNEICSEEFWLTPFWWKRLLEDSAYSEQLAVRWAELRNTQLATDQVVGHIDSVATLLNEEAQARNFTRWPILGEYVWPNAFVGETYQEEVDWMKDWVTRRLSWLDENLPQPTITVPPDTIPPDTIPQDTVPTDPTAFTSSNLPIVVIDTDGLEIVDGPKTNVSMGIIDNGPGNLNNLTDSFNDFEGTVGIDIRGSSSQMFPKKQYGVEVRDPVGKDSAVSLLGMPKEADWVLYAPYSDKSLMRNILAYQLGRDLGRYAPRTKLCEVVLNGEYQGVYVLIEKIKRDKNRVDIAKLKDEDISGEDVTGGYIIKIDKAEDDDKGWPSAYSPLLRQGTQSIYFQYEYPKSNDIVPEQQAYIQQFMASFEDALKSDDFDDINKGYAQYIDVGSFVDYFIANEVARNPDAYRISTFMHKQKVTDGGKLVMGPVWDFNLGFGNVDFCLAGGTDGFVTDYNGICPQDDWLAPFWWDRLFQDPAFAEQVVARWTDLRSNQLATDRVLNQIDSMAVLLSEAQARNFVRWPVLGEYVWPNAFVGQTYQEEVDQLKTWISTRLSWLDSNLPPKLTVVTSIEIESAESDVVVYPNPFRNKLEVRFTSLHPEVVALQVYDLLGRTVLRTASYHATAGQQSLSWDTSSLVPGTYIMQLQRGTRLPITRKITKP